MCVFNSSFHQSSFITSLLTDFNISILSNNTKHFCFEIFIPSNIVHHNFAIEFLCSAPQSTRSLCTRTPCSTRRTPSTSAMGTRTWSSSTWRPSPPSCLLLSRSRKEKTSARTSSPTVCIHIASLRWTTRTILSMTRWFLVINDPFWHLSSFY